MQNNKFDVLFADPPWEYNKPQTLIVCVNCFYNIDKNAKI